MHFPLHAISGVTFPVPATHGLPLEQHTIVHADVELTGGQLDSNYPELSSPLTPSMARGPCPHCERSQALRSSALQIPPPLCSAAPPPQEGR
jgi:hypothetical protein